MYLVAHNRRPSALISIEVNFIFLVSFILSSLPTDQQMITNNWFLLLFSGCFESRTPFPTKYNSQKRLEKVLNDVTIEILLDENVSCGFPLSGDFASDVNN